MTAPRKHSLAATIAYLVVCFVALPLSLLTVVVEAGDFRAAMELLRDTAPWPLALLVVTSALVIVLAVLGTFYLRGSRIPGAALIIGFVAPVGLGSLASHTDLVKMFASVQNAGAGERARLLGEGIATACGPLAVGAALSLLLALLVCAAAAAERLSLASTLDTTTLIVGAGLLLGSVGAHALLGEVAIVAVLFWAAMGVAVFGNASRAEATEEDPSAWRRIALMAVALTAAALLVSVADYRFRVTRLPYALVDCMSFAHEGTRWIRTECGLGAVEGFTRHTAHAKLLVAIDVLAALAIHARALFAPAALGRGLRSLRVSFAIGALSVLAAAGAVLEIQSTTSDAEQGVVAFASRLDKTGIGLPALRGNPLTVDAGDGPLLTFSKDAVLKCEVAGKPADPSSCAPPLAPKRAAHGLVGKEEEGHMGRSGSATLGELLGLPPPLPVLAVDARANALAALRAVHALTPVLEMRAPFATAPQSEDADLYIGRSQPSLDLVLRAKADDAFATASPQLEPARGLGVLLDGPSARIVSLPDGGGGVSVSLDRGPGARREWEQAHLDARSIVIAPAADTDWQTLIDVASAFFDPGAAESKACTFACEITLTADRARLEELAKPRPIAQPAAATAAAVAGAVTAASSPTASSGPRLSLGSLNVQGSLPNEVVRRIIRLRQNQLAYCFERRVNADPSLKASGSLRLVIGPSGQVQAATTTIADSEIASCITRMSSLWVFPAPEGGGSVIVTQALELHP